MGAAVQPSVYLNKEKVGDAVPQGFYYVDRNPGDYEVSTTTEVERKCSLTLDKGQNRYIKLNISLGFFVGHVYPELVDEQTAMEELGDCKYAAPSPEAKAGQ